MADTATASPDRATNIILLIGDGMGLTQLSTAYYYGAGTPNFSRFRHIGLHQNQPVGAKITDSAAGATAFSAGIKSYNGAIGVDQDTIPQQTILEWAALAGKRTGVVATSTITHATPASFYAHVFSRNEHEAIALDFLDATVDFAAGGGSKYFGTNRSDGRDILGELEQIGYAVDTTTLPDMAHQNKKHAYLIATDALPKMSEGRGEFLSQATNLALDYLSKDPDGFFLMVEGSQIDWGGHDNDADYVIQEVLDFDQSVGVALDFAERDGNTLVIVTADHETGGLSLSAPEVFGRGDYRGISPTFSTGGHSAALVPVLAYGPGAELFTGIYQNSDIYHKMMRVFGADQMLSSNP
ncbi:MAG: alkaline phosphatase [Bacteroidota bacterium]